MLHLEEEDGARVSPLDPQEGDFVTQNKTLAGEVKLDLALLIQVSVLTFTCNVFHLETEK